MDTLDRERNLNNIIDRLIRLEERVKRLEERVNSAISESGSVLVPQEGTHFLWELFVRELGVEDGEWPALHMARVR